MYGKNKNLLYVGKAGNLRRRVESYFSRVQNYRIQKLVSLISKIDCRRTETTIEALILEAGLIKKLEPPFNVREKDDKTFLYVHITKDKFPRILLVRGKERETSPEDTYFGPFTSPSSLREALRIIRRIFPYNTHAENEIGRGKSCFDYQIGLCPGTCVGVITRKDYLKNVKNIKLFFKGKKKKILRNLEGEMKILSKSLQFEKAQALKNQIFSLKHINDIALIKEREETGERDVGELEEKSRGRVEGYDISSISGTSAVGAMVVFEDGEPKRKDYRKFRIKTIEGPNDVGMLKEILRRRLNHAEWPLPTCFLIDGGKGQVNAAEAVLKEYGYEIPVVGIAKGKGRRRNDFIGKIPQNIAPIVLIKVRNEAHRFAQSYHKKLRHVQSLKN